MKMIRTQKDIELLEVNNILPSHEIKLIRQEFVYLMRELEEQGSDPFLFKLPIYKAIILLEPGDDILRENGDI